MFTSDIIFVAWWWAVLALIGFSFFPLTVLIFNNFFDKGYIFAKILGIIVASYIVFLLGILHLIPFSQITVILVIVVLLITNILILQKFNFSILIKKNLRVFVFEELIFFIALLFWSYIRAHQPDIQGLEKFMDFGFVNSIFRADFFPPRDMWFTPFSINYYYFGHLITAVLTKLSGIPSFITYNLMLATLFAFTFSGAFSIGANLHYGLTQIKKRISADPPLKSALISGLLAGFLASLAGNLHTIYSFFVPYNVEKPVPVWELAFSPNIFPNSYWYPNATRFIENTIHEFPLYSFVVSDLHGHVLDIPIVLLTIAVLLSFLISKHEARNPKPLEHLSFGTLNLFRVSSFEFRILLLAFLLAIMYMTNAWDGLIYSLLTFFVFAYLAFRSKNYTLYAIYYTLILIGFVIFSLPFSLNFKPFVSGIGIVCAPDFLTNIERLGPFLFEQDHCQRSPWWQLLILYGFFYFFVVSFIIFLLKKTNSKHEARNPKPLEHLSFGTLNLFRVSSFEFRISASDVFVLILIFLSTLLIIIPEFVYAKDIYPAHYRANTMFKLVYESFIMLSITSAYIAVQLISNIKYAISKIPASHRGEQVKYKIFNFYYVYLLFTILFLILVIIYPTFAISSYYGDLREYKGLNGLTYLKRLYPSDYEAILWMNKNINGQPVILEANGDSYTDYGRVSTNTGLPTVLGWTVHEWLWRGSYDIPSPRINEVQTLYETNDLQQTKNLINKYRIELVFIGDLERQKYTNINEEKFDNLGTIIFSDNQTKIYRVAD